MLVGAVLIFRSIAARREQEKVLATAHALTQLTLEVGVAFSASQNEIELLDRVCQAVLEHVDATLVQIWTLDDPAATPKLAATASAKLQAKGVDTGEPLTISQIAQFAAARASYSTNPVAEDSVIDRGWSAQERIMAFATVPLIVADRVVGVAAVYARCNLPKEGAAALDAIATITASAIDRYRLARETQQATERFQKMIKQVTDYAVFMTDSEGRATTWNEGVRHVLGYSEEEFIGLPVKETIFTEEAIASGVPEWEFRTAAETGSCTDDRWMSHKDGTTFWASGITSSIESDAGELLGFNKIMRDLTHRKDSDDAIRQLNAELSASDRHKTQFLATLAHELRNPLSPVTSALALIEKAEELPSDVVELWKIVQRQVAQMVRLVDDLLDMSRISRGNIELRKCDCRLQPIIKQALESASPFIAESSHIMTVNVPEKPIYLNADPVRLAQVVTNLLNNAAKYTSENGSIQIDVQPNTEASNVTITVTDNGIGVEAEKIDTVFDLFAEADTHHERGKAGLGIGLALVKTLVQLHDGQIELHSEGRDKGTTVTTTLRTIELENVDRERDHEIVVASVTQEAHEHAVQPSKLPARNPRRVLVVDDLRAITFTLSRVIGNLGHEVETAANGREALEKLAHFHADVIFSDISMPEMNGYELAIECRRRFVNRRFLMVAMTGHGQDSDRKRSMDSGFDDHMVKPPDARVLSKYFDQMDLLDGED